MREETRVAARALLVTNFGSPEITNGPNTQAQADTSSGREQLLTEAMEACASCSVDVWSFDTWSDRIIRALWPAYRLFLVAREAGDAAIAALIAHPAFAGRKRAPRKNNPALLAVLLALKPKCKEDNKRASDYAAVLIQFGAEGIKADDFVEAMAATTLADCISKVRKARQSTRAAKVESSTCTAQQNEAADKAVFGHDGPAETSELALETREPDLAPSPAFHDTTVVPSARDRDVVVCTDGRRTQVGIEIRLLGVFGEPARVLPIRDVDVKAVLTALMAEPDARGPDVLRRLASAFDRDNPEPEAAA